MQSISEIRATEASGPGALPGFEATCSCGLVMSSSLKSALRSDIAQHAAYHAAKAKREGRRSYTQRERGHITAHEAGGHARRKRPTCPLCKADGGRS